MQLLVLVLAATAIAGDPKKVKCPGPNGKVERYVYKDCGSQFELYSRDMSGGLSVDVGSASGSAQASSTVVQLAMDEVNKELRTHYVAACTLATTDPCGPGMDAFQAAVKEISTVFPALRERASRVETPADAEAIGAAVRAALAQASTGGLPAGIDRSAAPVAPAPASLTGSWDVVFDDQNACNGIKNVTVPVTITEGALPGTLSVAFPWDGSQKEWPGTSVADELRMTKPPGPWYPWVDGSLRIDSTGRLVGTARLECSGAFSDSYANYRVGGHRR